MKNCLICENIKNEKQFKDCWVVYRNELENIIKKANQKISTVKQETQKTIVKDSYKPDFYIDKSLMNLRIDYCFYEYLEERLLKYYFFIQRNLEQLFYKWAYLHNDKLQSITFAAIDHWTIFKAIKKHENFVYLEIVWAFANLYKHNSQRAEKTVEELLIKKSMLKNTHPEFSKITNKVIQLFDEVFLLIK